MRRDIKDRILKVKNISGQYAQQILSAENIGYEDFCGLFRLYMCSKFLLEPEEITTDDFYEICRISADKISGMPRTYYDEAREASNCSGATTALNKKVLFMLALKEELGTEISPQENEQIDTWSDLCCSVYGKLTQRF